MSAETRGDLSRSTRWDEAMRPVGIGDVATVACRDALGCWGWIEAYRDRSDRSFEDDDLELLASIAPSLGSALRRTMYGDGPSATTAPPHGPGVIVLDEALAPVSSTAAARSWLDTFPDAPMLAAFRMLPAVIYPAAATARSGTSGAGTHAIVQSVDRRWVMIEAAKLEGGGGQIAVTLRAATAAERFGLLCRAYALSQRERQVVAALVAGLDTHAITQRLYISPYTVQDHLKSVFAKTGVRSRRELLARFSGSFETAGAESA